MAPDITARVAATVANSRPAQMVLRRVEALHDDMMLAVGRLECHLMDTRPPVGRLEDVEFSVFSQFGEDGIIQYLLRHVKVPDSTFVEVGVGNYRESNTRFLVENNNWRGIAVNGDDTHARFILGSKLDALPEADRAGFVTEVRLAMAEPVVDYVRLEIDAVACG